MPGTDGSTSTPAVFGGVVYFGNWDGTLRAVSAADGTAIWTRQLTNTVIDDSPLLHANRVYVGDGAGNLHAVDSATGVPVWSRDLDPHPNTRIFSSPIAVDDMIVVGVASVELAIPKPDYTFRGSIVALDADTGVERWRVYTTANNAQQGAGVSVWSSAAVDSGRGLLYIGTGQTYEPPASPRGDALMAIEYATGAVRWIRQFTADDVYTIFGQAPQGPDADLGAAPNLFRIGNQDVVGVGDKAGVYAVFDRDDGSDVWARAPSHRQPPRRDHDHGRVQRRSHLSRVEPVVEPRQFPRPEQPVDHVRAGRRDRRHGVATIAAVSDVRRDDLRQRRRVPADDHRHRLRPERGDRRDPVVRHSGRRPRGRHLGVGRPGVRAVRVLVLCRARQSERWHRRVRTSRRDPLSSDPARARDRGSPTGTAHRARRRVRGCTAIPTPDRP